MPDHGPCFERADHDRGVRPVRLLALALLLGACASEPKAPAGCARTAERTITWSDPALPDRMTARSEGADCVSAIAHLTITNARGDVLLRGEASYALLNFGDRTTDLPAVSPTEMSVFLEQWLAGIRTLPSNELPDWHEGESNLPRASLGSSYDTHLDRASYLALRERGLSVLCFDSGPEAAQCHAYDPVARRALPIAGYGV